MLFQRQMKRDTPATESGRALRMLCILYSVLILITVSSTKPLSPNPNSQSPNPTTHSLTHPLFLSPFTDPNHLPPHRILPRLQKRHPRARRLPIRPRLDPHALRPRPLQHRPPGPYHAGPRERLAEPEAEEGDGEGKRQGPHGGS